MANEALLKKGTKITLGATGTTTSISTAGIQECVDAYRQPQFDAGYPLGIFEFKTAAGGFSLAPTAGAVINLYEQKINSAGLDAPNVTATYKNDYIGSFIPDVADSQQYLTLIAPIHIDGGKYWVEWVDGGAGTASVDLGWELTLTPASYGT